MRLLILTFKSNFFLIQNTKKHKATKKNLKANAEKGSLFKTIGNVVIKAEDHSRTNIKGKNFGTLFLLI